MGGRLVNNVPCGDRNVAMVFQNYALFPHMTVKNNIIYGLKAHKVNPAEIESRLNEVLNMLDLKGLEERRPRDLSGGQRQRVALARAVVKQADYFLLDEPLSNLDAQLRLRARKELVKIHEISSPTLIYVTHDQIEAMTVGQRIALMHEGRLQMLDTPENVYNRPANVFTAKFIGSPSMNIIESSYAAGRLTVGGQQIRLPEMWCRVAEKQSDGSLYLGIRPEHLVLKLDFEENTFAATVKYVEDYGSRYGIYLECEGREMIAVREGEIPEPGTKVWITADIAKLHLFDRNSQDSLGYPEEIPVLKKIPVVFGSDQKTQAGFDGKEAEKGGVTGGFTNQYQYV